MPQESTVLAEQIVAQAQKLDVHIATAESLTGGLLSSALVDIPGASRVFSGGVVAYATELKHKFLGVDQHRLDRFGPVDPIVAMEMARGVKERCSSDFGVATTGVAGPDPDPQTGLPAGVVFVGVSSLRGDRMVQLMLSGSRSEIRDLAVVGALAELLTELNAHHSTLGN